MLPSGPRWKSLPLRPSVPTKHQVTLYYRDPIECLQALLSHPLFEHRISFVPRKVWSTAGRAVRVYEDWLSGNHAWELQVRMARPLLYSAVPYSLLFRTFCPQAPRYWALHCPLTKRIFPSSLEIAWRTLY